MFANSGSSSPPLGIYPLRALGKSGQELGRRIYKYREEDFYKYISL